MASSVDCRLLEHRRETFLKFYAFHIKYKAHPGGAYYIMPWLAERFRWTGEEKLWYAYLNGNTQNPVMSWLVFKNFPRAEEFVRGGGEARFNNNWPRLQWDMDRRYQKK